MMLKVSRSTIILRNKILSPILFTSTTLFIQVLSTIISTPFFALILSVYQSLNHEVSSSLAFVSTHLVSWRQKILILLLIIISTTSIDFPIKVPIFHVPKQILFTLITWINFFTHVRPKKCGSPYSFNIAFGHQYNGSNSFDTILELYNMLLSGNDLILVLLQ